MNQNLDIFKITDASKSLNFNPNSICKFGFVISKKYENKVIYLPNNVDEKEAFIHHGSVLWFTLEKLFADEKRSFFKEYEQIVHNDDEIFYMDREEIIYSGFLASLNSIVFLNIGDYDFRAGVIFIPKEMVKENNKDEDKSKKLDELLEYLGDSIVSSIVVVPLLEDILKKHEEIKYYELSEYKKLTMKGNKVYKYGTKQKNVR